MSSSLKLEISAAAASAFLVRPPWIMSCVALSPCTAIGEFFPILPFWVNQINSSILSNRTEGRFYLKVTADSISPASCFLLPLARCKITMFHF